MNTNNTTSPEKGLFADKALVAPAILVVVPSLVAGIKIVTKSATTPVVACAVVLALLAVLRLFLAARLACKAGDCETAKTRRVGAVALAVLAALLIGGAYGFAALRSGVERQLPAASAPAGEAPAQ